MSAKAGGGVRGVRTYAGPGFNDPEFVEHVFSQWCLLTDFNLPAFDKWLSEQTDSPAIEELREKRAAAVAAFQLDPNDEAGILWHRDYLLARWQLLSRTSFLLRLARTGDKVTRGGMKGGAGGSNSKASAILAAAEKRTAIGTGEIMAIARETGAHVRTVRDTLSKAGRYTPRKKNGK